MGVALAVLTRFGGQVAHHLHRAVSVALAAGAHWCYRMLASVVLMTYALPCAGAIASEQSARRDALSGP